MGHRRGGRGCCLFRGFCGADGFSVASETVDGGDLGVRSGEFA